MSPKVIHLFSVTVLLCAPAFLRVLGEPETSYDAAARFFKKGEYDKVILLLETSLAERRDAAAFNLLSLAYLERKRYEEALAANQQAVKLRPDNPNYLYNCRLILLGKGDSTGAEKTLRLGLSRFPRSARLYEGLGEVLYRRDSFMEAESLFREAVKADPNYGPAYVSLAKVLYAIGDRHEFAAVIQKSVALEPENYFACYLYGTWLVDEADRKPEAISFLQRCLMLNPRFIDGYIRLADLEMREHRLDAALVLYQRAIKIDSTNARLYYLLAAAYRKLGKDENAEDAIAQYRRLSR